MGQLDIHVVGFEKSEEEVLQGLQQHFGLPPDAAQRFYRSIPRVARHCANAVEARAYERALLAVGALVELRPAQSLAPTNFFDVPSLPAPPVANPSIAGFDSSARLAERIPRAAAVPMEAWSNTSPSDHESLGGPALIRDDLGMSDEFFSEAPLNSSSGEALQRGQLRHNALSSHSETLAATGQGSLQPTTRLSDAEESGGGFRPWRIAILISVLVLVMAGLGYYRWWNGDAAQRERDWKSAGIAFGEHAPATEFVRSGTFAGFGPGRGRDLVSALLLTGAVEVHAINIRDTPDGAEARALLVVLPETPSKRSALFWLQARAELSEVRVTQDEGQRFLIIEPRPAP